MREKTSEIKEPYRYAIERVIGKTQLEVEHGRQKGRNGA